MTAASCMSRRHVLRLLHLAGGFALPGLGLAADAPASGALWPAWNSFRAQFVSEGGRVIDSGSTRSQTFSEGQGYALFFALVANDRAGFEKILRWTEDNLCQGDITAHLPAWLWGKKDDNDWGVIDSNSASDADLWIAYSLGEAGRLWKDRRYQALSSLLGARVLREETADLPGLGLSLLPAPKGFTPAPDRWRLNPSYMPLQLMRWFAQYGREPGWKPLLASALKITIGSAPKGFVPDWVIYDARQGFVPDVGGEEKGQGAYNAIRVYLWAGMLHPDTPERKALLQALLPMAHYVRDQGYPPESIDIASGQAARSGPSGFSAALLPFLEAQKDEATLQTQLTRLQARPVRADAYYEQALGLFALGWRDGFYRFGADGRLLPRWSRE